MAAGLRWGFVLVLRGARSVPSREPRRRLIFTQYSTAAAVRGRGGRLKACGGAVSGRIMRVFNVQDVTGQPRATKWARMKLIMTEFPSVFMTLAPFGKNRPRVFSDASSAAGDLIAVFDNSGKIQHAPASAPLVFGPTGIVHHASVDSQRKTRSSLRLHCSDSARRFSRQKFDD